ncbi:MSHA biogenesis protein MshL [hydrothermal vent metagenome]|uniref:MSHA biogenesis protein MshL n=1 Tax=hydrothermal vent metagenome TaxID=652676 RepID=A0A1W1BFD3_9ZZZZ
MKYINRSVCASVLALMLSTNSFAECSYELFSIDSTKESKIIDFVNQLSDECGYSLIITDKKAEENLNKHINKTHLKNLTINEVLDIILGENNLAYTLKDNLLKISYLTTKIYNINYILSQRKSSGSTDVTLNGASSGSGQENGGSSSNSNSGITIESTDEVDFWNQLDTEFRSVLNRPEDRYKAPAPIINKNAGLITVTATKRQLERFGKYLKKLQDKVQLQVLINVKILSVTMSKGKSTGIDWRQLYSLEKLDLSSSNTFNSSGGVSRIFTMNLGGSLNQVIKFLKTQGDVTSLSNPKVLTLNNQPALITSGTEYFYKLASSTTQQGTGGGVAATTQNNTVQSVFAGVLLSITPEISDDKTITLKINPSLSETTTNVSQTLNTGRDMPPDLNRRQLSSVVTVKDGNRIILGGLISTQNVTNTNKVPLLGDIPFISSLFKYEEKTKETRELVIIIEPHIIHKKKDSISLSELGYATFDDSLLKGKSSSKQDKKEIK